MAARLIRLLLAAVTVWLVPFGLPAAARADAGPDDVVVGVYVNDIQDIDIEDDNFTADLLLWMLWRNPALTPWTTIEVMNAYGKDSTGQELQGGLGGKPILDAPQIMPDGTRYMGVHYRGVFSRKMYLQTYPFDVQNLRMVFENQNQDSRQLQFVPDTDPIAISQTVTNPGYRLGTPALRTYPHTYLTNFGDRSAPAKRTYSRIVVTIPVKRDYLPYVLKIMLPILIVVLITSLIYVLPPRLEEARAGVAITALLTIVAMNWNTDSGLPSVGYLTLIDSIYILSMLYILVTMGYTVVASRRNRHEMQEALAKSLDRKAGLIAFTGYLVLLAAVVLLFVTHQNVEPGF